MFVSFAFFFCQVADSGIFDSRIERHPRQPPPITPPRMMWATIIDSSSSSLASLGNFGLDFVSRSAGLFGCYDNFGVDIYISFFGSLFLFPSFLFLYPLAVIERQPIKP